MCPYLQEKEKVWDLTLSRAAGVLQSGDSVQAGGAARRSDQEEHHFVSGCLQGISGQTCLQEKKGKTAAHKRINRSEGSVMVHH